MENDSTLKDYYFFELARRDQLNRSLSFPVGITALLGGAMYAMSQAITPPLVGWKAVLAVMLSAGSVCLLASILYIVKAYWNYNYKFMPFGDELLEHKNVLLSYHESYSTDKLQAALNAARDFLSDLDETYAKYGRINSLNNDSKSSKIFRANGFLIGALACAIFCMPIFVGLRYSSSQKPAKIEIVNLREIGMTQNQQDSDQAQPPREDQQHQPQQERPTMPPGRDIKEHVDPLRKKSG